MLSHGISLSSSFVNRNENDLCSQKRTKFEVILGVQKTHFLLVRQALFVPYRFVLDLIIIFPPYPAGDVRPLRRKPRTLYASNAAQSTGPRCRQLECWLTRPLRLVGMRRRCLVIPRRLGG